MTLFVAKRRNDWKYAMGALAKVANTLIRRASLNRFANDIEECHSFVDKIGDRKKPAIARTRVASRRVVNPQRKIECNKLSSCNEAAREANRIDVCPIPMSES